MEQTKRTFSLLLLLALLLSSFLLLASCSNQTGNPSESSESTEAPGTVEESDSETEYNPLSGLAVEDYNGYEFKMIVPTRTWAIVNMTQTDITADPIQDSIYERQVAIEARLNIKLSEEIYKSDVASRIMQIAGDSGDSAYDLALVPTFNALELYKKNYVYDQTELENLDLSNPWWEDDFNRSVNIGDRRYVSFGNANLIYYSSFYLFAFNMEMIENYHLESPYDLVDSGKWTWDKVYEMMQIPAQDNNSDGFFDPAEDILGLTGHVNHSRNLILSSSYTITDTDSDGYPVYNGLSDNYISAFTKWTNYFITSPYVAIAGTSLNPYRNFVSTSGIANYVQVFMDGRSLFLSTGTNEIILLRDTTTQYGIVVVPKYQESQMNYITPVYSATEGFVIPTNVSDPARTALIFETLGALSYHNLVDTHIQRVLHYKVANDPTAISMINLAYSSGAIDVAMANNFGTCTNMLNNLNVNGATTITSVFGMIQNKLKRDIEDAINGLD